MVIVQNQQVNDFYIEIRDKMKDFQLSFTTLAECKDKLSKLFINNPKGKYRVTLIKWTKKRSVSMNRQQHLFYNEIAKFYGDRSSLDVKNMCKDAFGLPILHNSEHSGEKIDYLTAKLGYYESSYENKMKLIQCLSVTSLFNTSESKEYCDNMITYFNGLDIPIKYKD